MQIVVRSPGVRVGTLLGDWKEQCEEGLLEKPFSLPGPPDTSQNQIPLLHIIL